MGYWKARMFNRKAASKRSMPDMVIRSLALKKGWRVADIGAGGGYFSLMMANEVGKKGSVYAVDTDERSLTFIRDQARCSDIGNIETVHTDGEVPELPLRGLDLVLMRNVCHHIADPATYFKELGKYLKKDGIVAVIDYDGSCGVSFHRLFHHSIDVEEFTRVVGSAGYEKVRSFDFLPEQSFTLFRKCP